MIGVGSNLPIRVTLEWLGTMFRLLVEPLELVPYLDSSVLHVQIPMSTRQTKQEILDVW